MIIERVSNGWIVTNSYRTSVYTTIEEALTAIYRGVSPDWIVGDRIIIIQREQKEQP